MEVVEVLADIEDLESDEILEIIRETMEAVEAGIKDTEVGHVAGGLGKECELVGVHGELPEVCELKTHGFWEFVQLIEVSYKFF